MYNDKKYTVRRLLREDYDNNFLAVLRELTSVGYISRYEFYYRVSMLKSHVYVWLLEGKVVATGSVLIEPKFIHQCGSVAHIEDVVVSKSARATGLGADVVNFLRHVASLEGCYKVILSCSAKSIGFYKKCGFEDKDTTMVARL